MRWVGSGEEVGSAGVGSGEEVGSGRRCGLGRWSGEEVGSGEVECGGGGIW